VDSASPAHTNHLPQRTSPPWQHWQHVTQTHSSLPTLTVLCHLSPLCPLLYRWLEQSLELASRIYQVPPTSSSSSSSARSLLRSSARAFFSHFHSSPNSVVHLQHQLVKQAAQLRFDAAIDSEFAQRDGTQLSSLTSPPSLHHEQPRGRRSHPPARYMS
jgi:hypothetical protein